MDYLSVPYVISFELGNNNSPTNFIILQKASLQPPLGFYNELRVSRLSNTQSLPSCHRNRLHSQLPQSPRNREKPIARC